MMKLPIVVLQKLLDTLIVYRLPGALTTKPHQWDTVERAVYHRTQVRDVWYQADEAQILREVSEQLEKAEKFDRLVAGMRKAGFERVYERILNERFPEGY